MITNVIKAVVVIAVLYFGALYFVSSNIKKYYVQCTEEYNRSDNKTNDMAVIVTKLQVCVDNKKGFLEKVLASKSTVSIK